MSAPDTDVQKQAKRHRGALFGIAGVVVFAMLLFLLFLTIATDPDETGFGAELDEPATERAP